ncbi:GNAT family N-acetyltransferase [Pseudonocardia acaciae]|uniref:GNAT family N-acetyltransferase n=1 Tax=Pseudonocardia acaciae TaxID=551276 RepID=UPI00048ADC86|nr:GNAT family N-acetyltransferase [Pseudonocardia acaciae]
MIEVRALGPDEWRVWRKLRLEALAESPAAFGSKLADWTGPGDTEARWRSRLAGLSLKLVLRADGAPAGIVGGYIRDDGVAEMVSLWVAPFARGLGVGDAAVRTVLVWADPRDVMLSVKVGNEPAIALYRRHGFVDAGPSPTEPDERLMRRSRGSG